MIKVLLAVVAALVLGTGVPSKSDAPSASAVLAKPYSQFGFDALRELALTQPNDNIFISPTSIAVALAMTTNGANGSTRDAILKTLHSEAQPIEAFNSANRALTEEIAGTKAVQLSMANALWLQQKFSVDPSFTQALQTAYGAQAGNLDFRSPAAVETINAWVAKHTNNRISKIIDRIDPSTLLILANAIAFKGKWSLPFDPKETQAHDFKSAQGAVSQVQMMKHTAEYSYANANGLEAIRLPYADGTFAMYVVLPQDASGLQPFLQQLSSDKFTTLVSSLHPQRGTIELPRFTITYDATLNTILKKLSMGIAFGDRANFDGICKGASLEISDVRHASFLKVDEEGTEAAAATTIGIRPTAMRMEPPPFHMIVDHPFFIAIRDERNGQVLFAGVIGKPLN